MHPLGHALVSAGLGWLIKKRTGRFSWVWWSVSSFADADHYLWYVRRTGDWHLLGAWRGSRDEMLRAREGALPLHRWRVIVAILLAGKVHPALRAVGTGLLCHRVVDEISHRWPHWRYRQRRARYYRHWLEVAERAGYRCQACGRGDTVLELHHRISLADGGRDHPDNMVLLCTACHDWAHGRRQ